MTKNENPAPNRQTVDAGRTPGVTKGRVRLSGRGGAS